MRRCLMVGSQMYLHLVLYETNGMNSKIWDAKLVQTRDAVISHLQWTRRSTAPSLKTTRSMKHTSMHPNFYEPLNRGSGIGHTHDAEEVSVGGADVDLGLDKRLPLLDERAELVTGEIHPVEVGQDRGALDVLAAKLDLPVTLNKRRWRVKVSQLQV